MFKFGFNPFTKKLDKFADLESVGIDGFAFQSGIYYSGDGTDDEETLQAIVANRIYAIPITVQNNVSVDRIGIEITTAGAGGTVIRFGVFSDNGGVPGNLVFDSGEIAADSIGAREVTVSESLPEGRYWLVLFSDGTPTVRSSFNQRTDAILGWDQIANPEKYVHYYRDLAYTSLPNTFGAGSFSSDPAPLIMIRVA